VCQVRSKIMMLWGQNLAEQMGSGEEGSPDACLRTFTNRQARGPHKATWNQEAFSIVVLMAFRASLKASLLFLPAFK